MILIHVAPKWMFWRMALSSDGVAGRRRPATMRQARAENAFFRYKSIIGDGLRAKSPAGQLSEAILGCQILNRMTDFGRATSYSIGR